MISDNYMIKTIIPLQLYKSSFWNEMNLWYSQKTGYRVCLAFPL